MAMMSICKMCIRDRVEVVVVLTKADLVANPEEVEAVRARIDGFIGNDRVLVVSEKDPELSLIHI